MEPNQSFLQDLRFARRGEMVVPGDYRNLLAAHRLPLGAASEWQD